MASERHTVPEKVSHKPIESASFGILSIILLGLLVSMGALHTDPIASALPGMAQELGASSNSTAVVVSAFLLGMTIGHLLIGPISDIIGRNRAILAGLTIMCVGAAVCALSPSVNVLIAGRVIQGLGGAATLCSARATGGDAGDGLKSARLLSLMQITSSATPIFMPLLGDAVFQGLGWRSVFWMMLIVDALLIAATLLFIPAYVPTKKKNVWRTLLSDVLTAVRRPAFVLYTLAFGFGISTFYCYVSASSFALQNELGVSATTYSRYLSLFGVVMVFTAMLASRLPKRFGLVRSFSAAVILQFFCAVLMAVFFLNGSATVLTTVICYALIAGSASVIIPMGLSLAISEAGAIKGSASALCGFMQCLCSWLITSLLSGVNDTASIGATAGIAMAATTFAALCCCIAGTKLLKK